MSEGTRGNVGSAHPLLIPLSPIRTMYRAERGKRWDRHQRFRRRLRGTRRTNTAKEKMRTSLVPKFRMYPETTFRFRSEGRKEQVQERVPAVGATVLTSDQRERLHQGACMWVVRMNRPN